MHRTKKNKNGKSRKNIKNNKGGKFNVSSMSPSRSINAHASFNNNSNLNAFIPIIPDFDEKTLYDIITEYKKKLNHTKSHHLYNKRHLLPVNNSQLQFNIDQMKGSIEYTIRFINKLLEKNMQLNKKYFYILY